MSAAPSRTALHLFRIGSLVAYDPANPGYLKAAAANQIGEGATVGLLIQEDAWDRSIYVTKHLDSYGLGVALNNRNAVITSGAGTKVWLKNTAGATRADGRVITAVTMVDLTGVNVLDYLTWDGAPDVLLGPTESGTVWRRAWVDGVDHYAGGSAAEPGTGVGPLIVPAGQR